ncbi:hypothetical protein YH63_007135 [Afipia massiliensis]|uniref:Uncharacterized protein n=1 Tax=Afipia massiliensis TaxID=211460 RepID=A0A4U6BLR0_9BRAD|nr:hypothetical protein [Afipia massiliensis]TKT71199.1 hypothetical protein YH63_007135 [Afipia massiliensis]
MTELVDLVRAKISKTANLYIHNDLAQAVNHFKDSIDRMEAADDRAGISYEYMACGMMIAFAFEAKINFLGWKLIEGWREFQSWDEKVKLVCEQLGIEPDWGVRPWSSIRAMKRFRDMVAHGKPLVVKHEEVVVMKAEDLNRRVDLTANWEKGCKPHDVNLGYDDLQVVWHRMLKASEIEIFDTMTRGEGAIILLEKIPATTSQPEALPTAAPNSPSTQ